MSDEKYYTIVHPYYLYMDTSNFILAKKIISEIGNIKYNNVAFYPLSTFGLTLLYEKFVSLCMNASKANDLNTLTKEMKRYYAAFTAFIKKVTDTSVIQDLSKNKPQGFNYVFPDKDFSFKKSSFINMYIDSY